MKKVVISLGSNMGERIAHLQNAINAVLAHPDVVVDRVSSVYETEPIGGPDQQGPYLNAVAVISTDLDPHALLSFLNEVESKEGRTRDIRFGPRTLDLDIVDYEGFVSLSEELTVPHPRAVERSFVLTPLFEIAPDWQLTSEVTLESQLERVADQHVKRCDEYQLAVGPK